MFCLPRWPSSATYQSEGLAIRLGLGRQLPLLAEPGQADPAVSRLGSKSSMSSTSSCSSTSWSRMHLTEYWPNTPSCAAGRKKKKRKKESEKMKTSEEDRACPCSLALRPTHQLLAQLTRRSRLVEGTPSPQKLHQRPQQPTLQNRHKTPW